MRDLADFVRARLAEREARARAVDGSGRWSAYLEGGDDGWAVEDTERGDPGAIIGDEAMARHIAENDPDHVLREVEAKRQIVDEVMTWKHDYVDGDDWFSCGLAEDPNFGGGPGSGCADDARRGTCDCGLDHRRRPILASLASLDADHSDYREEWRP